MTNTEMFKLKLQDKGPQTARIRGKPVKLPMKLTLTAGWNWMPYPYQEPSSLLDSGGNFDHEATQMNIVKHGKDKERNGKDRQGTDRKGTEMQGNAMTARQDLGRIFQVISSVVISKNATFRESSLPRKLW